MTPLDAFSCPLAPPLGDAVAPINFYFRCVLAYRPFEHWSRVIDTADACESPMLKLLAADYLQQSAAGDDGPLSRADALVDAVSSLSAHGRLPPREAGYLVALRATRHAKWSEAYDAWLGVVRLYPSDLFAVKRAQFACLMNGNAEGMLDAASAATAAGGELGRYYFGLLSFGLEQCRRFEEAEKVAREGLKAEAGTASDDDLDREDKWLQHGLAHALYFQGRHPEAADFLRGRAPGWRRSHMHPFLFTHLWWHLALLETEEGRSAAALDVFDTQLWADETHDLEVQVNALGLLVRLHVRKVDVGDRWDKVVAACAGAPYIHAYPLHNLLRLCALCAVGRDACRDSLIAGTAKLASEDPAGAFARVVLPLAQSIPALFGPMEVRARAQAKISSLRGIQTWAEVGGSEEQRGFLLELVEGPVRAGVAVAAMLR